MDAATIFATVSLMMLVNGLVLVLVSRDLPSTLRPAANYWQLGTMLIALGCAVFAFGGALPRPIMLVTANGLWVFGLTAYHAALQEFEGIRPRAWQLLPGIFTVICIAWFSAVSEDFWARIFVVSIVWAWLMLASILTLVRTSKEKFSVSRKILTSLFALVLAYHVLRVAIYLQGEFGPNFAIETGNYWLNLLTPIFMTLLPIVGTTAFLLLCSDNLRQQLETSASTDYLTGLLNRRMLAKHGAKSFQKAEDQGIGFAIAVLDIDNFKAINDTYGHGVGDQVLVEVASHLREQGGTTNMVARAGGEEFAVLLSDYNHATAAATTDRMRRAVEQANFSIGSIRIPVTLSAGVAVYRTSDRTFEDIFRRADQALYIAKTGGRNRVEIAHLSLIPT